MDHFVGTFERFCTLKVSRKDILKEIRITSEIRNFVSISTLEYFLLVRILCQRAAVLPLSTGTLKEEPAAGRPGGGGHGI